MRTVSKTERDLFWESAAGMVLDDPHDLPGRVLTTEGVRRRNSLGGHLAPLLRVQSVNEQPEPAPEHPAPCLQLLGETSLAGQVEL